MEVDDRRSSWCVSSCALIMGRAFPKLPDDMVEAAARALAQADGCVSWDDLRFELQERFRVKARNALDVAGMTRLIKLTARCTCEPFPYGEGPQADCLVHGAIRAFNEACVEIERLQAERDGLVEILSKLTHDYDPGPGLELASRTCRCGKRKGHAVHRTPGVIAVEKVPGG